MTTAETPKRCLYCGRLILTGKDNYGSYCNKKCARDQEQADRRSVLIEQEYEANHEPASVERGAKERSQ